MAWLLGWPCKTNWVRIKRHKQVTASRAAEDATFLHICVLLVEQVFDKLIENVQSLLSLDRTSWKDILPLQRWIANRNYNCHKHKYPKVFPKTCCWRKNFVFRKKRKNLVSFRHIHTYTYIQFHKMPPINKTAVSDCPRCIDCCLNVPLWASLTCIVYLRWWDMQVSDKRKKKVQCSVRLRYWKRQFEKVLWGEPCKMHMKPLCWCMFVWKCVCINVIFGFLTSCVCV